MPLSAEVQRHQTSCKSCVDMWCVHGAGREQFHKMVFGNLLHEDMRILSNADPTHDMNHAHARASLATAAAGKPPGDFGTSYILNPPPPLTIPVHHVSKIRPFIGRIRFIVYLKHPPSFGKSGSPYIYLKHALERFRYIIYLKQGPSCGYIGSSYFFNTPPPLAIPVHHGLSSILNMPPHLVIPVRHIYVYTHMHIHINIHIFAFSC